MRRPLLQRQIFSLAQIAPRELIRSKLSKVEMQHRALTYLPNEILRHIPPDHNVYSLFEGFQASIPEEEKSQGKKHKRHGSRNQKMLEGATAEGGPSGLAKLKQEREILNRRLQTMSVRKNMCSAEIREIDNKIANLNSMRKIVLERLANLEHEELVMEHDVSEIDNKIEDLQEHLDDAAALGDTLPSLNDPEAPKALSPDSEAMDASFMSESIYEKLPSPKTRRHKANRRKSMPILHEHLEPGSRIREFQAHNDVISALDFDVPFGTLVTAALDDTVRVWDLNLGRCMGMLEGHLSSVRCLQVEEHIVATGSMDASIRLWDLSRAEYATLPQSGLINKAGEDDEEDDDAGPLFDEANDTTQLPSKYTSNLHDCPVFSLEAHVAEVTALHFQGNNLVSGSADKTLRQWDIEKGRCVQTLDVLWAAAQASASGAGDGPWRQTGNRLADASADFVGALQCFDAALACGTADGMVRLWDLRSGQVHRSLVGHTGPITCLQFDDVHLVTGSLDRSIRVTSSYKLVPCFGLTADSFLVDLDMGPTYRIDF